MLHFICQKAQMKTPALLLSVTHITKQFLIMLLVTPVQVVFSNTSFNSFSSPCHTPNFSEYRMFSKVQTTKQSTAGFPLIFIIFKEVSSLISFLCVYQPVCQGKHSNKFLPVPVYVSWSHQPKVYLNRPKEEFTIFSHIIKQRTSGFTSLVSMLASSFAFISVSINCLRCSLLYNTNILEIKFLTQLANT